MSYEENLDSMPVDIVYLWVNGNDPEWRKKRALFTKDHYSDEGMNNDARYADNSELKYALRSLDKFAPWIRKVFLVTDNQIPDWLEVSNPKIKIIDHKEIISEEFLPTFNSVVIEHNLYKIPGLSEHFLYSNDDMFFGKPVNKNDFFSTEGLPIIRLNRRFFRKTWTWIVKNILKKNISNYNVSIQKAAEIVERDFKKYIQDKPHHNIDAYRKTDYKHTFETFRKDLEPTLANHTRNDNDIQRVIYSYLPIIEKKCIKKYVTRNTSYRCHIASKDAFINLEKRSPLLFCLNDSQYSNDEDRLRLKDYLKKRFPYKSQFEK